MLIPRSKPQQVSGRASGNARTVTQLRVLSDRVNVKCPHLTAELLVVRIMKVNSQTPLLEIGSSGEVRFSGQRPSIPSHVFPFCLLC